jgi:carbamoylphosphate synthase large subunit
VKEAVLPFNKFDVDIILGPEMRSTGEVMGFDESFGMAFAKAEISLTAERRIRRDERRAGCLVSGPSRVVPSRRSQKRIRSVERRS